MPGVRSMSTTPARAGVGEPASGCARWNGCACIAPPPRGRRRSVSHRSRPTPDEDENSAAWPIARILWRRGDIPVCLSASATGQRFPRQELQRRPRRNRPWDFPRAGEPEGNPRHSQPPNKVLPVGKSLTKQANLAPIHSPSPLYLQSARNFANRSTLRYLWSDANPSNPLPSNRNIS